MRRRVRKTSNIQALGKEQSTNLMPVPAILLREGKLTQKLRMLPFFLLTIVVLYSVLSPGNTSALGQENALVFHWSPPKTGAPVDHYKVYRAVDVNNDTSYKFVKIAYDTISSIVGSAGHTYWVKVSAVDSDGVEGPLSEASPDTTLSGVDETQGKELPKRFSLSQNFPNPFNSSTTIRYTVPQVIGERFKVKGEPNASHLIPITLKVYNSLGEKVRDLIDGEKEPGYYRVVWDGRDNFGEEVCSGVYFYRLEVVGDRLKARKTKRMVVIR